MNVARELCAGRTFEFTAAGDATLKRFDELVSLYGLRIWPDRASPFRARLRRAASLR